MTKRRLLVFESIILSLGFWATQMVDVSIRYGAIFVLGLVTYLLTAFILRKDLKKIGWLVVLVPPVFYVVSSSLFYFLLPQGAFTRLLIIILYGVGIYALLLSQNIFSIGALYTIQLLRAAQAVGFLITLVIIFFVYNTIFSFRLVGFFNGLLVFVISLPIIISSVWSVVLEDKLSSQVLNYSFLSAFLVGQMAYFISFWPLSITTASLFLVSFLYVTIGLVQNHLVGKLFKNNLREFLQVGIIIFIITIVLARWG